MCARRNIVPAEYMIVRTRCELVKPEVRPRCLLALCYSQTDLGVGACRVLCPRCSGYVHRVLVRCVVVI